MGSGKRGTSAEEANLIRGRKFLKGKIKEFLAQEGKGGRRWGGLSDWLGGWRIVGRKKVQEVGAGKRQKPLPRHVGQGEIMAKHK